MEQLHTNIAVVGAGVAGLMVSKKLSELGFDVSLIEKGKTLASGPSTKNEGWLHSGTYHSAMVADKNLALMIAKQCIYGYEQIKAFCPEAIEEPFTNTYALVKDPSLTDSIRSRWEEADIHYQPVPHEKLNQLEPDINIDLVAHAFRVDDLSVNTRIFYAKMLAQAKRNGVKVFTEATFKPEQDNKGTILIGQGADVRRINMDADLTVITTGFAINEIYQQITGKDLDINYWKSHLFVYPKLTRHSLFFLDGDESTIFNHGGRSIVSQQMDARLQETPTMEVVAEGANRVREAIERFVPKAREYSEIALPIACIKPTVLTGADNNNPYSVNTTFLTPNDSYIFALPGKMTATPFLADTIIQWVFNREMSPDIALRPYDNYGV